jgi:hypothetical protein
MEAPPFVRNDLVRIALMEVEVKENHANCYITVGLNLVLLSSPGRTEEDADRLCDEAFDTIRKLSGENGEIWFRRLPSEDTHLFEACV